MKEVEKNLISEEVKILQQDLGLNENMVSKLSKFLDKSSLKTDEKKDLLQLVREISCDHVAGILFFEDTEGLDV
tara:strand:+ start:7357 stop:7578 length:222 start_codon:yes stop_codon:yes gene_type:complete